MKKLIAVAIVGVLGLWGWRHVTAPDAPAAPAAPAAQDGGSAKLVTNRVWIDHLPRGERDTVNVFAALESEHVGVFQATSMWQGSFEAFRFDGRGGTLRLVFPQTGTREQVKAHARHCDEGGMDYCLELRGSDHGVKRYYSQEGWEIGSLDDARRLERTLAVAR